MADIKTSVKLKIPFNVLVNGTRSKKKNEEESKPSAPKKTTTRKKTTTSKPAST